MTDSGPVPMIVGSVVAMPGTSDYEPTPGLQPKTGWEPVWHYTNGAGLLGIIRDNTIWASSVLTLNDSSEVEFGMAVLAEVWETIRGQFSPEVILLMDDMLGESAQRSARQDIFIACASKDSDSLNQWQGYAGAQGYAISLNTRTPWAVHLNSPDDFTGSGRFMPVWVDVIYDPIEQRALAQECLTFYADKYLPAASSGEVNVAARLLSAVSARFKHGGFKDESEVRLIYVKPYEMRELFRPGPRGLVPYLRLGTPSGEAKSMKISFDPPRRLHTWQIVCGPANESEQDAIQHAVKRLVSTSGHPASVKVTSSSIPYRFA